MPYVPKAQNNMYDDQVGLKWIILFIDHPTSEASSFRGRLHSHDDHTRLGQMSESSIRQFMVSGQTSNV